MSRGFFLVIIFIAIIAVLGINYYSTSFAVNFEGSREVDFKIESGETVNKIADSLKEKNLISNRFFFKIYVYLKNLEHKFQIGEFKLYSGMNMREIVEILTSSEVPLETKIAIIEGWNKEKIADYLEKRGLAEKKDFLKSVKLLNPEWLVIYEFLKDKPIESDLEGYLFPDTYRIYRDSKSNEIVSKMLNNFDRIQYTVVNFF